MSSRQTRNLVKEFKDFSTYDENPSMVTKAELYEKTQRSFDKSITALKIALNKLAAIIEQTEDDWIVHEILMQHKGMLSAQIDLLIREKKKL
jgi:ParB family transcriptional regulator, chromosome partitioning protein